MRDRADKRYWSGNLPRGVLPRSQARCFLSLNVNLKFFLGWEDDESRTIGGGLRKARNKFRSRQDSVDDTHGE